MRIDGRAWILLLAGTLGCGGSSVTVSGTGPDGKIYVDSQGGSLPPVGAVVSEKGVEEAPTPTPGQPTPKYPIDTPAPAPSPTRSAGRPGV